MIGGNVRRSSGAARLRLGAPGALLTSFVLGGCAFGRSAPPSPGWTSGTAPALEGVRVLLLPVQAAPGIQGDVDAELAFGLQDRGPGVDWVLPDEVRKILARSPGLRVPLDALPVGVFLRAQVRRVGDPLYGDLRRLGALTDATAAFLPVQARGRAATDSVGAGVEITAALVEIDSGVVLWEGVVEGLGGPGSPRALAEAVDALGRALLGTPEER